MPRRAVVGGGGGRAPDKQRNIFYIFVFLCAFIFGTSSGFDTMPPTSAIKAPSAAAAADARVR